MTLLQSTTFSVGHSGGENADLFSLMTRDRTEGNGNEAASGEAQIGH